MRIDLPGCDLHDCRYYFDGNCLKSKDGKPWLYNECPHTRARMFEEEIFKLKEKLRMKICKYAEDRSGDVYECTAYYENIIKDCEFCHLDLNPDGSINIAECKKLCIE